MYAPEHLIVNVEDAEQWLNALDNAGTFVSFQDFESMAQPAILKLNQHHV